MTKKITTEKPAKTYFPNIVEALKRPRSHAMDDPHYSQSTYLKNDEYGRPQREDGISIHADSEFATKLATAMRKRKARFPLNIFYNIARRLHIGGRHQ